jgi:hypothetical protein
MNLKLPQGKIVGVFGPVASGKTYLIEQWLKDSNRFVRFDSTGEAVEDTSVTQVWASPKKLLLRLQESPYYFRIAYQPGADLQTDFHWVLKALWVQNSDKLLVVDEFHLVYPNNSGNQDAEYMLRFGRHCKLAFVGVSQRIADVHKLFTSSCRMTVIFWTQEARDLDAIKDRWGSKVANMVANLRPLIYDDVNAVTSQVPQCVVYEKGGFGARIFDFQTDSYVSSSGERSMPEVPAHEEAAREEGEEAGPSGIPDSQQTGDNEGD